MDQSSESLLIPKPTGRDIWRFAWHYWSQRPKFGILAFLFLGISVSMDIFFPVYTGKAVDHIARLSPDHIGDLGILLGSFGIILALQFGHSWLWSLGFYCWNKFANHILHSILTDTTRKVLRFSTDWHANSSPDQPCVKSRAVCGRLIHLRMLFSWDYSRPRLLVSA